MFSTFVSLCLALTAVALVLHRLGVWATFRHTRGRPPNASPLEALTVLKPIKGLEEQLEQNLRSFFEQAYPAPLQFVFSSTEPSDPGMLLARRVAADYPQLRVWFVTSDASFGVNPKVSNLAGALRWAEHDLILQTDANVRVRPDYFQAVVREYRESGAALLGGLIAGAGERSIGAVLDNIQLTTFTTPGICLAQELVGIACVIGKSIVYRKSELESLGGLERVKDVLAEDYVLGQAYVRAGKRVMLSHLVVDNVNVDASFARFWSRHSRWLKMRVVVHVGGFAADLISNATFFAVLAAIASGFEPSLLGFAALVIAYKTRVDLRLMTRLRGRPLAFRHRLCMPLRDLLLPCVWLYALFSRTTEWRGQHFRLSRGSLLTPRASSAGLLTPLMAADAAVELEHHGDA